MSGKKHLVNERHQARVSQVMTHDLLQHTNSVPSRLTERNGLRRKGRPAHPGLMARTPIPMPSAASHHSLLIATLVFFFLFQKWVPSDERGQPSPTTGVIFINRTYWKLILLFWQLLTFQTWASTSPASEPLMEPGRSPLKHASGELQHVTSSVSFGWLTDKALSWTEADH